MENEVEVIRKNQYRTSSWSGGTTTEILIYPRDAKYSERNFKWRISSAGVEAKESVFTHLPGISRIIMVIDGEMLLEHEGRYKVMLYPFKQDSFMGDWVTKSYGRVRDFNLMMAEGCTGKLEVLSIECGEMINVIINEKNEKLRKTTEIFYLVDGEAEFIMQNKKISINGGESVSITGLANGAEGINILNKSNMDIKIIRAVVYY